jgi:two-component system response regulator YesN
VQSLEGFQVIAVCKNGSEALQTARKKPPDIIITDVRMPGLSGLDFIKQLSSCHSEILVISGYAEFEYAQEAHRLGVFDYILKPIDIPALIKLLYKIADEIDVQAQMQSEKKRRLGLLAIQGNVSFKSTIENLQKELDLHFNNITPIIIGVKCSEHIPVTQHKKWLQELSVFLSKKFTSSIIFSYEWNLVCLMNHFTKEDAVRFGKFIHSAEKELSCRLYCGIGLPSLDFLSIGPSYHMARVALSLWCYHPEQSLFEFTSSKANALEAERYCRISLEQVTSAIENADLEGAEGVIRNFWDRLVSDVAPSDLVRLFLTRLMSLCNDTEMVSSELTSLLKKDLLLFRRYSCSLEQLENDSIRLVSDIIQLQKSKKIVSKKAALLCIIEYTQANYNQNLTLDDISEMFHINKSYLCKIFKDAIGMTYNNYLLKLRIEHAKQLMENPCLKIYEISDRVGFQDAAYFSKIFRDWTGYAPSKYRHNLFHYSF